MEGGTSGKELKSLPPKTGRKIRAALKRAVAFWRQIQLLLADDGNQGSATADLMRRMNQEICNELQLSPKGSKRSHEIAEIMGLTHKQLRVVAEIYNPNCFGPLTQKFGLTPGKAFDLTLGDNLLDKRKQNEVIEYLRQVKPGLVLISPPCRMHSQLQNLSKRKRENMPELMKEYLKKKQQSNQLLIFAIEICHLCLELGMTFVFEHPLSASSWKHRAMERILRLPNVFMTRADQCCYGLRGASGLLHRKATGFMTNDENMSRALSRRCDGSHQHEAIIGGNRSRKSQEYPIDLRETILKTYKDTIQTEIYTMTVDELFTENDKINELFRLEFELLHQGPLSDSDELDEIDRKLFPGGEEGDKEQQDDQECHSDQEPQGSQVQPRSKEPLDPSECPDPGRDPQPLKEAKTYLYPEGSLWSDYSNELTKA